MRALLAGLVPGLPDAAVRAHRRPRGRASRCTPSRPSGCCSPRGGSCSRTGRYAPVRRPRDARRPGDAHRADRGPPRRARPRGPRASSWTPPSSARASPSPASRRSPGVTIRRSEPRLRALVRRELLASRRTRGRRSAASTRSSRRSSARSPTTRSRSGTARSRHLAAARYFETLGTDELAGALAGHYLAAARNAPEGPEADALAAQARIALRGAASGRSPSASHDQAIASSSRRSRWPPVRPTGPTSSSGWGSRQTPPGSYQEAYAAFEEAGTLLRGLDDRHALVRVLLGDGDARSSTPSSTDEALALLETSAVEFADLGDDRGGARDARCARPLPLPAGPVRRLHPRGR